MADTAPETTAQGSTAQPLTSPATSGSMATDRESKIPVQRETSSSDTSTELSRPASSVSPFALMRAMMDDMDRMFGGSRPGLGGMADALLGTRRKGFSRATTQDALWLPAIDVSKRGDQLVVHAELPGLSAQDVNVEVEHGTLTISGERHQSTGDQYHSERSYGSFYRAIPLPENVDVDQIKANFQNGVLEVTMPSPSPEQDTKRKIEVT
jgi:HSP20 family protein